MKVKANSGRAFEKEASGLSGENPFYISPKRSLAIARSFQPDGWDPINPNCKGFLGLLHRLVKKNLKERRVFNKGDLLKLYLTIALPADYYHGTDAFFDFHGSTVTIDITLNEQKQFFKADFLIKASDVTFQRSLKRIAYQIAGELVLRSKDQNLQGIPICCRDSRSKRQRFECRRTG
jgi:hypothetical protein